MNKNTNNIEIELRYEVVDITQLPAFLARLNPREHKRVVDSYLDTTDADFLKKGIYIRIRNNKKMDIKFNRECLYNPDLDLQPYCEEYSFALPLRQENLTALNDLAPLLGLRHLASPDVQLFMRDNQLINHRIVDKMRSSYTSGIFTIYIDEVVDLGTFLEIELMTENINSLDNITQTMEHILAGLTLRLLKTGYDSLVLKKQNFAQYIQGRFALKEDKVLYAMSNLPDRSAYK